ncbi:hypothetical protein JYU34_001571 [Plutella xylostella]|uniref:Uncharacterized protein n=1 Tax=Plutella xylostella TaxID=51655 RepID=A0ABQ7R488_PLUXY|nr:hypothetical protein JYU34_001571 [Plutella xylostella]
MCLAKESESPAKEAVSPRSPWAKLLNRQNSKPKLPRKVASSARVNLNKCWSKLGELMSNASPRAGLPALRPDDEPLLIPFTDFFYPVDPVKPPKEDKDNIENQNLLNGRRFEAIEDPEINDNMANEVREICYSATKNNCFVCKLCY